jgi:hypothetical protein
MAESEATEEFPLDEPFRKEPPGRPHGRRPLHLVFQITAAILGREKSMGMDPFLEWPGHLLIPEEAPFLVIGMAYLPPDVGRTLPERENDSPAVSDPSLSFQHLDGDPRRRKSLQSARASVPGKHIFRRVGQMRPMAKQGHYLSNPVYDENRSK